LIPLSLFLLTTISLSIRPFEVLVPLYPLLTLSHRQSMSNVPTMIKTSESARTTSNHVESSHFVAVVTPRLGHSRLWNKFGSGALHYRLHIFSSPGTCRMVASAYLLPESQPKRSRNVQALLYLMNGGEALVWIGSSANSRIVIRWHCRWVSTEVGERCRWKERWLSWSQ